LGELLNEMRYQEGNVVQTQAQGWKGNGKHIKPVIQVHPELLLGDHGDKIPIGRSHYANIDPMSSTAAQSFELLLLQDAQQFRLEAEGHVADFIQKQRASVRSLESPYPLNYSTGESTSFMAEEFAFQKVRGDRGTVYLNERSGPAFTFLVDGTRDRFLTRSGFALDENCAGGRTHS
jgi:hypothetical protein